MCTRVFGWLRRRFTAAFLTILVVGTTAMAQQPAALQQLEKEGVTASMAIYPVGVLARPDQNVADVLGLLLEKQGMTALETDLPAFVPPAGQAWEAATASFADFVEQSPPKSAYALYAEYLGDPRTGPTAVRWTIVSRAGAVLLHDEQAPADSDFKATAARDPDPMGCSMLVARRLFKRLNWKAGPAPEDGAFAKRWAQKSGTPDSAEREAMKKRAAALRTAKATARVAVFSTRINQATDAQSATRLALAFTKRFGGQAAGSPAAFAAKVAASSNQQKRMWDLARGLRDHLRAAPPDEDYAMVAEFLIPQGGGAAHAVCVVVCDKAGDWVIVDCQNNQHDDFQRIAPKSAEDCERLVLERLAHYFE